MEPPPLPAPDSRKSARPTTPPGVQRLPPPAPLDRTASPRGKKKPPPGTPNRLQGTPLREPAPDRAGRSRLVTPPALNTRRKELVKEPDSPKEPVKEQSSSNNYWKEKRLAFEVEAFLDTIDMMKDMKPFERKRLTPFLTSTTFGPGEVIVAEGAEADAMYFLREGVATATIVDIGEVRRYEKGSYFGELALLMGSVRAATVTAGDSGTVCYRLGADHFRDVPKYVRLSFMKHAAFAYAKQASVGDTGLGKARAPSSLVAKSESELKRYIEATVLRGKRMRPVSQRNLDDDGGNSSDSSSDSDYESPTPSPTRSKSVSFGPVVESDVDEVKARAAAARTPAAEDGRHGGGREGSPRNTQAGVLMTRPPAQAPLPKLPKRKIEMPKKKRGGCCGSRPSIDD